jgi:hypothetical protein
MITSLKKGIWEFLLKKVLTRSRFQLEMKLKEVL